MFRMFIVSDNNVIVQAQEDFSRKDRKHKLEFKHFGDNGMRL